MLRVCSTGILTLLSLTSCLPGGLIGKGNSNRNPGQVNAQSITVVRQPESQSLSEASSGSLEIALANDLGASFQWYRDDHPIPGATERRLSFSRFQAWDQGRYFVGVSLATDTGPLKARSTPAELKLKRSFRWKRNLPTVLQAEVGSLHRLEVEAEVENPDAVQYVWEKNSLPISGANQPHLELGPLSLQDIGNYRVRVRHGTDQWVSETLNFQVINTQPELRTPSVETLGAELNITLLKDFHNPNLTRFIDLNPATPVFDLSYAFVSTIDREILGPNGVRIRQADLDITPAIVRNEVRRQLRRWQYVSNVRLIETVPDRALIKIALVDPVNPTNMDSLSFSPSHPDHAGKVILFPSRFDLEKNSYNDADPESRIIRRHLTRAIFGARDVVEPAFFGSPYVSLGLATQLFTIMSAMTNKPAGDAYYSPQPQWMDLHLAHTLYGSPTHAVQPQYNRFRPPANLAALQDALFSNRPQPSLDLSGWERDCEIDLNVTDTQSLVGGNAYWSNMGIRMSDSNSDVFAGKNFLFANGSQPIKEVYLGTGNDRLILNQNANIVWPGKGNDTIVIRNEPGRVVIVENPGEGTDMLHFTESNLDSLQLSRQGNHLRIRIKADHDVLIPNFFIFNQIEFIRDAQNQTRSLMEFALSQTL